MLPELDEHIEELKRAGRHDEAARVARAGANAWVLEGFSLRVREDVLTLADLDAIVQNAQPEFPTIPIFRWTPMWPSMGNGPVSPDFALLAIFTAVAFPFLAELGKDAYRAFRAAVFVAYNKGKNHFRPLGFRIEFGEQQEPPISEDERQSLKPNLYFGFSRGMNAAEFERALRALLEVYDTAERPVGYFDVLMEWDGESGAWVEEARE